MATNRFWLLLFSGAAGLALLAGCEKPERITTYTVDKPPPIDGPKQPEAAEAGQPAGEPTDRTVAAIVPLAEQGWFFKLTGPKDAVQARAEDFSKFVKSVRFSAQGKPEWSLPEGWSEQGGSQIRFATIIIPAAAGENEKPLEISVTVLPKSGDDADYILVNVNRWRNQLKLPPIAKEQLAAESTQLDLGGTPATLVNLLGVAAPNSMGRPPFMSGAPNGN
jgi:hypothetical protein